MKKLIAVVLFGLLNALGAHAAGNVGQCVFPDTKTAKNGNLEFKKPIYIYATPSLTSDKVQLKVFNTYTVAKETNGFIQLQEVPGFDGTNPNAGKLIGWTKLSDFRFQDLRNCN